MTRSKELMHFRLGNWEDPSRILDPSRVLGDRSRSLAEVLRRAAVTLMIWNLNLKIRSMETGLPMRMSTVRGGAPGLLKKYIAQGVAVLQSTLRTLIKWYQLESQVQRAITANAMSTY
jgi:hypothetical protein